MSADSAPVLVLIAAVAANQAIGRNNQLLWHLPADLAHFKRLTAGHIVIMGRKTWESLPSRFRPLPNRHNIVVSRQPDYSAPGATVAPSLDAALAHGTGADQVFVIGGEQLYRQAIPIADRLEITEVSLCPDADAWFPVIDLAQWKVSHTQAAEAQPDTPACSFVTYCRR